jgi:hypothetical protein
MWIPIELVNYCLFLANTGTKMVYNKKTYRHEIYIDRKHPKHFPIFHLLQHRYTQTDSTKIENKRINTIVELPFLKLPNLKLFFPEEVERYYASQLLITQENEKEPNADDLLITWNPYILTEKISSQTRARSYSMDILFE